VAESQSVQFTGQVSGEVDDAGPEDAKREDSVGGAVKHEARKRPLPVCAERAQRYPRREAIGTDADLVRQVRSRELFGKVSVGSIDRMRQPTCKVVDAVSDKESADNAAQESTRRSVDL
jgi:hypothetical protein